VPADSKSGNHLENIGLEIEIHENEYWISDIGFMSPVEKVGLSTMNDNQILGFEIIQKQPVKKWFILPALLLLGVVVLSQRRRIGNDKLT